MNWKETGMGPPAVKKIPSPTKLTSLWTLGPSYMQLPGSSSPARAAHLWAFAWSGFPSLELIPVS